VVVAVVAVVDEMAAHGVQAVMPTAVVGAVEGATTVLQGMMIVVVPAVAAEEDAMVGGRTLIDTAAAAVGAVAATTRLSAAHRPLGRTRVNPRERNYQPCDASIARGSRSLLQPVRRAVGLSSTSTSLC